MAFGDGNNVTLLDFYSREIFALLYIVSHFSLLSISY